MKQAFGAAVFRKVSAAMSACSTWASQELLAGILFMGEDFYAFDTNHLHWEVPWELVDC
jgi:hypothetical protein